MVRVQKWSRFTFTFKNWTNRNRSHVENTLSKETCKFAVIVRYKDKLLGYVNSRTPRSLSEIQKYMGRESKINAVHRTTSDVDVDNDYQAMVDCGGYLLRIGTPARNGRPRKQRPRLADKRVGVTVGAENAVTGVGTMCVSETNCGVVRLTEADLTGFQKVKNACVQQSTDVYPVLRLKKVDPMAFRKETNADAQQSTDVSPGLGLKKIILTRFRRETDAGAQQSTDVSLDGFDETPPSDKVDDGQAPSNANRGLGDVSRDDLENTDDAETTVPTVPKSPVSSYNMLVSGIADQVKARDLKGIFVQCGHVAHARIVKFNKDPAHYGLVTMSSGEDALKCVDRLNATVQFGAKLFVRYIRDVDVGAPVKPNVLNSVAESTGSGPPSESYRGRGGSGPPAGNCRGRGGSGLPAGSYRGRGGSGLSAGSYGGLASPGAF